MDSLFVQGVLVLYCRVTVYDSNVLVCYAQDYNLMVDTSVNIGITQNGYKCNETKKYSGFISLSE